MLELNTALTTLLNIALWPIIHMVISWYATKIPLKKIPTQHFWIKRHPFETTFLYKNIFYVQKWKLYLPDAATWFDHGFAKAKLNNVSSDYLQRFYLETIRGELAHWLMLLCTPLFFLWNPLWACMVMLAYGLCANLPCIITQRYNRHRIQNVLRTL